jgi:GT2 family glycosyltransferase
MNQFFELTQCSLDDISKTCKLNANVSNSLSFKHYRYSQNATKHIDIYESQNNFTFNLLKNKFRSNISSVIIICSKDNAKILNYSLNKLKEFGILEKHDVLLVDDRSINSDISDLSEEYDVSYLRIDNESNIFNYSAINNIAALYAQHYNKTLLIFYNNDMWPPTRDTLDNLINKHKEYNSNITGCKLLYPTKQDYEELGKPTHLLSNKLDEVYNTIQHGGIFFIPRQSYAYESYVLSPVHSFRFYDKDYEFASYDQVCFAVTGALHIINTKDFFDLGGLNTHLSGAFQDIDLCLKALMRKMKVYYIGSEYMYHAESITNAKENLTKSQEFVYDHISWDLLWTNSLSFLLGQNINNKKYL